MIYLFFKIMKNTWSALNPFLTISFSLLTPVFTITRILWTLTSSPRSSSTPLSSSLLRLPKRLTKMRMSVEWYPVIQASEFKVFHLHICFRKILFLLFKNLKKTFWKEKKDSCNKSSLPTSLLYFTRNVCAKKCHHIE